MRKNVLRIMVTAVIAATTIGSFSSLGVSAATINENSNGYYKTIANNLLNSGWAMNNGNWNYFDNAGTMQTGVINVDGKTYCLNQNGAMETGKVIVDDKTYTTNSDGQVTGTKASNADRVFDSNNNVVKDNGKTSTVNSVDNNQGTTTNNDSTAGSSGNVQGLPQLPQNYSINVQAAAEQKILELMNQKRVEAGLQPLTSDNKLVEVARYKSNDMIQNNFFSHTNPDGTKWTNWLHTLGYEYTLSGENIAYNTSDAVELFNQWWNSPGHRANMMNSAYNKVGIGVIYGNGKYMGSQEFSN
jgi:uncharacterized protein YkwD